MEKTTLAYIAGLMDGEAYIGIKKTKPHKRFGRFHPGYHACIQIRMVDEAAIKFVTETFGGTYYREKANAKKGRPLYCFRATDARAVEIIKAILPYLRVKKPSAENVLALREHQANSKRHRTKIIGYRDMPHWVGKIVRVPNLAFSDEYIAVAEAFYTRGKEINRVGI